MATFAQFKSWGPYFSGGSLCTLRVYHYVAGTTTDKDMYTTRTKSATVAQPLESDADGIARAYADGLYKIRIDGSTDGVNYTTLYTDDNVAIADQTTTSTGGGDAITCAATLTLPTSGDWAHVTGSTGPVTAISGTQTEFTFVFDSTPTLTHSGNLILQNSTNYTATANDIVTFKNEGSNVWREINRSVTIESMLKPFNTLTADTTPDLTADYVLTYDASASTVKRALANLAAPQASFGSIGQTSTNNSGTPNTIFDLDADYVRLWNPTTGHVAHRANPGAAISNNVGTAGPAVNGRDQSGAFSAGSWVHFYWIWDGTTLATVSSAAAPPTGPTLTGDLAAYDWWCYAGAVYFNGSSQLVPTRIRGSRAYYETAQSALSGGGATTETSVSLTALVPSNAVNVLLNAYGTTTGSTNPPPVASFKVRFVTGKDYARAYSGSGDVDSHTIGFGYCAEMPVLSQSIFYLWENITGSAGKSGYIDILGYGLPNGGV